MIASILKVIKVFVNVGGYIFTISIIIVMMCRCHSLQTFAFTPLPPPSSIDTLRGEQVLSLKTHATRINGNCKSILCCKFRRKERGCNLNLYRRTFFGDDVRRLPSTRASSSVISGRTSSRLMMQQQPFSNRNKGLLQILNDEVSDLLLERLSQKLNANIDANSRTTTRSGSILSSSSSSSSSKTTDGLSKFHRNILASTTTRQRCVTGKYPLHITITENPTRKWLSSSSSSSIKNNNFLSSFKSSSSSSSSQKSGTSQMLVNGTSIDKSLASFDRYQWLDEYEQQTLHQNHTCMSIELVAEIYVKKPGYVNILSSGAAGYMAEMEEMDPFFHLRKKQSEKEKEHQYEDENQQLLLQNDKERMWITGFSLTKQSGELHYIDIENGRMGSVNKRSASSIRWPNEVNYVPKQGMYASCTTVYNRGQRDHLDDDDDDVDENHQPPSRKSNMYEDALLVSDGFLVPGKDNGGLYVTLNPGHETEEWNVCLAGGNGVDRLLNKLETRKQQKNELSMSEVGSKVTKTASQVADDDDGWFYHRAVWVDLTNDGRQSILTARAKRPSILKKNEKNDSSIFNNNDDNSLQNEIYNTNNKSTLPSKAQLVWLERPKPHRYDEVTGTPLDKDGLVFNPFEPKHTPWKLRVLDEGPDVMFSIADMDTSDDTVEVFASQFFNKKVTMHSIQRGDDPRIVWKRDIDDRCGASFSSILATLDMEHVSPTRKVVDCGSTIQTLGQGDSFSHLLVTSHECTFAEEVGLSTSQKQGNSNVVSQKSNDNQKSSNTMKATTIDGGSLFAYRVPEGKDGWKTKPWTRSVISTGFRVKGQLGNFINPGAPGFCYTFYPTKHNRKEKGNRNLSRPLIAIAGDCAESAYIYRPIDDNAGDDPSTNYAMMCEIECGATVGSIGVGYEDFCFAPQQNGYAKIYVPCYEKDKVLVFAMGNGEDDEVHFQQDGW